MLRINADRIEAHCDGLSRRNFLQIGSLAMGGMALPQLLHAEEAVGASAQRQKSVIMIYLGGGPSHQDMWDIKEGAHQFSLTGCFLIYYGSNICYKLGLSRLADAEGNDC